jgi:hypothetical protein
VAAARPAGPEPTTATVRPLRTAGGCGWTQPSAKPRSAIAFSMYSMVTGLSLIDSTHADSHGAGQMRPVNSGKLLVRSRRRSAPFHSPRNTRSLKSGMMFPSGQPW